MICRALVGWTISPTKKSENARQQSRVLDGVRKFGVLQTARRINELPTVAERAVRRFMATRMMLVMYVAFELYHSSSRWTQVILLPSVAVYEDAAIVGFTMPSELVPGMRDLFVPKITRNRCFSKEKTENHMTFPWACAVIDTSGRKLFSSGGLFPSVYASVEGIFTNLC